MKVSKEYKFEAAHFLPGHEKCGKMHGHTYTVTVSVEGSINPETGMVIDYHLLNDAVKPIIDSLDHKCINEVFEQEGLHVPPTTENLTWLFLNLLQKYYWEDNLDWLEISVREGHGGYATDSTSLGGK